MAVTAIIIPARYPAKPLATLKGASGISRSLLERSVIAGRNAVAEAGGDIALYVATDDERIAEEARRIGPDVIMTAESCRNGTEGVAEAVKNAGITAEINVNLQGDAPLTPAPAPRRRCDPPGVGQPSSTHRAWLGPCAILDEDDDRRRPDLAQNRRASGVTGAGVAGGLQVAYGEGALDALHKTLITDQ